MSLKYFIKNNKWFDSLIRLIFISAFAVATINHVMDLLSGGWFPYTKKWGTPEIFNIYWTSLTILDPFAIIALIINVRMGYIIAISIMLTDVPINMYINANYWSVPMHKNVFLILQTAFLLFLLSTGYRIWKLTSSNRRKII